MSPAVVAVIAIACILMGLVLAGLAVFFILLLRAVTALNKSNERVAAVFEPLVADGSMVAALKSLVTIAQFAPPLIARADALTAIFEQFSNLMVKKPERSNGELLTPPIGAGSEFYGYDETEAAVADAERKARMTGFKVEHLRATPPAQARIVLSELEPADPIKASKPPEEPPAAPVPAVVINPPPAPPTAAAVTSQEPMVIDTVAPVPN